MRWNWPRCNNKLTLRLAELEADRVNEAAVNGKKLKALFDEVEVCNKRRVVAEAELRDRGIRILLPFV